MRSVVKEIPENEPKDVAILDMEASIEHLSRGTLRHVEAVLVVTEPYYRSLETCSRIVPLARELGIPRIYVLANKVRSLRDDEAIREFCLRHDYSLLGSVPWDEKIAEADRACSSLLDYAPEASAVKAIEGFRIKLVEGEVTSSV